MSIQQLLSTTRRAITEYRMIEDGDRIAVGLSGGKDSLALLKILKAYQRFSPQKFSLIALTIDLGFKDVCFDDMVAFCKEIEVEYHIEHTDIADIIFDRRKEKSPCSLCSKMRRGALNSLVIGRGYNKLALGHHADDLIETFLLSLMYEGRLSTFAPYSYMDKSGVTLIRPLIFTEEKNLAALARDFPVLHNPCPVNHHTKREYMKDLLNALSKDIPSVKERMHAAITQADRYNLWDRYQT